MNPVRRRAVIDIGTNSVKLLVADVDGRQVNPISESSEQTRLGAGFFETNRLQPARIEHTARAVARFKSEAKAQQASSIRVIATSAARDATNAHDLTHAIQTVAGLPVEIISGEQEAEWVFAGVATDPQFAGQPVLLLDVGGGSTEFILGRGTEKQFQKSFQLGTVRLLEKMPPGDPPQIEELDNAREFIQQFLRREATNELAPLLEKYREKNLMLPLLVGTGGTVTLLARIHLQMETYERDLIESVRLSAKDLKAITERLWSLPLAERRNVIGLPKNRADVILTGIAIYESVMDAFGFSELRISTRGLRFAALMD